MKISIGAKLFLAVLAACAVVIVLQSLIMRASFQRGFIGYLNDQGLQSMQEVRPRLAAAYRQHGSWDFLVQDVSYWFGVIKPRGASGDPAPRLTPADETGAIIRMGLLDARLRRIAGNRQVDDGSLRLAIEVDGRTVGWVAMVPFERALAPGETRFIAQQRRALWLIGAASIAIAALLAFVVTRAQIRRVRSLARATHAVANGQYASRIDVRGSDESDELVALALDFNRMAQALEHTEHSRRSFMADISHELRTPLAVIRAEIEAIQDGIRPASPQSLAAAHREVGRLGKLIDDLHDLSLTDAGAPAYRHDLLDLSTVLKTTLDAMAGRLAAAGLQLQCSVSGAPLIVRGDEARLQQLFTNLLENSLRYTWPGGRVRIHCAGLGDDIVVVVEDSKPGVPDDMLEHVFDRFYRVDASRNRASGGSGLGLAICRNIVEAHNGRIVSAASPLGGLSISIQFPAAAT